MTPPGVGYLLRSLFKLAEPVAGVYGVLYAANSFLGIEVSRGLAVAACLSINPLLVFVKSTWKSIKQRREAEELGAVEVQTWYSEKRWPGNFDLLLYLMDRYEHGHISEGFWVATAKVGNVFKLSLLGQNQIFTIEPEHAKQLLATEFNNFEKGDAFKYFMHSVLGTGVFNADGDLWKFHRSMTRPFFSRDRISHFNIFERHADSVITLMKQRLQEGHAIDFQDIFFRFTLDSASEFLFGSCVNSLDAGLPYPHNANVQRTANAVKHEETFSRAFANAQIGISVRSRLSDKWPLWEIFSDRTAGPMKIVNAYLEPILSQALARKKLEADNVSLKENPSADDIEDDETLLDHLVKYTDDKTILKDELLNIMIAARDTTATTLTFVIYLLTMHPDVCVRLRREVLERVGSNRNPTYEDIKEMKFLRAVINETLRLFPPVPFNQRTPLKSTTLAPTVPGGKPYYVPAKTNVIYSVYMMQRRKDLWGPDALEFDPDRFLDERLHKYLTPNPFIFLPFNAGPRICLGQQFAYNEASFMLIRLLQSFSSFELDTSAQPPEARPPQYWKDIGEWEAKEQVFPKSHLTLYIHGGLWVKLREAVPDAETA